jgi:hypothetical protein
MRLAGDLIAMADKDVGFQQILSLEMKTDVSSKALILVMRAEIQIIFMETKILPGQEQKQCFVGGFIWCSVSSAMNLFQEVL